MNGMPGLGYRPGLDGVRALAVAAVLLFHLDRLPGGNLGVDAFFVVSGWLITSKLLEGIELDGTERRGTVRLRRFWASRLRRLMPASIVVLIALAVIWPLAGIDLASLRADIIWAALGLSNWGTIAAGGDYWARFGEPSPVTHYWSLAIEQQFYFVWPLVLVAIVAVTRSARVGVAVVSVVGAVGSIVFMNVVFDPIDPTAAYMNSFARAHTLLIGAAAAAATVVLADGRLRFGHGARRLAPVGIIAAVAIVAASSATSTWMFSWGFPAFALAMAVVVVAVADGAASPVMASRPMAWLGDRSYGLYLWHWPVFLLMSPSRLDVDDSWLSVALLDLVRVAVSVALADLSYRWLETPIRQRRQLAGRRAPIAAGASLAVLGLLVVTVVPTPISTADTSVVTLPPPATNAAPAPSSPTASAPSNPTASAPSNPTASAPSNPTASAPSNPTASAPSNPTASAPSSPSASTPLSTAVPSQAADAQAVASGPLRVLVTGDSMAVHLSEALLDHAASRPEELLAGSAAFGGCGLTASTDGRLHEFTTAGGDRELLDISGCITPWSSVLERVSDEAIDVVIVHIGPWDAVDIHLADDRVVSVGDPVGRELVADAYREFTAEVTTGGATVVWVTPPDTHLGWGEFEDPVNDPDRWEAMREVIADLDVIEIDLPGWLVAEALDGPDGRPDGVHLAPGLNERFVVEMVAPTLAEIASV
jgi:peptidoglycan/LPS O-acetylase OafA/YrhL